MVAGVPCKVRFCVIGLGAIEFTFLGPEPGGHRFAPGEGTNLVGALAL